MNSYYKKCPNGHYYKNDLAQCPYCSNTHIEDDERDLKDKVMDILNSVLPDKELEIEVSNKCPKGLFFITEQLDNSYCMRCEGFGDNCPNKEYYDKEYNSLLDKNNDNQLQFRLKVCPNQHEYSTAFGNCPYCGSEIVESWIKADVTHVLQHVEIKSVLPIEVSFGGCRLTTDSFTVECWSSLQSNTRNGYCIQCGHEKKIDITCNSIIQRGKHNMKGSEFIMMCDAILDNQLSITGK